MLKYDIYFFIEGMQIMNHIKVTKELIDDCVSFIAGYKSDCTIRFYEVKNENFPNSLLAGNEREQEIMTLVNNGYSLRKIADKLKLSKGTVSGHIANYYNKINFYYEYTSFYRFIAPILDKCIEDIITDADETFYKACIKSNITSLKDLFYIYTHNSGNDASKLFMPLFKERKKHIFDKIADECYLLLTD